MALDRGFIEVIEGHIPPGFFVRLIEEFEEDYSHSTVEPFAAFEEPEAHDLMGDERRARTETSLAQVARQFAHRGIREAAVANSTFSNFHREITAGPVVLTASFVHSPNKVVREARFRNSLAEGRELSFFEEPVIVKGERLYAVLLHGYRQVGKIKYPDALGFLQLAIPNRSCTGYEAAYNLPLRYAKTEVDPEDIAASMNTAVPIEPTRRPSALLREYRRWADGNW